MNVTTSKRSKQTTIFDEISTDAYVAIGTEKVYNSDTLSRKIILSIRLTKMCIDEPDYTDYREAYEIMDSIPDNAFNYYTMKSAVPFLLIINGYEITKEDIIKIDEILEKIFKER